MARPTSAGFEEPILRRLSFLVTVVALVAMALPASALAARQGAGTCSNGWMQAGTYSGFTVTGTCTIAYGANVQINGNLILAKGASLDDHGLEAYLARPRSTLPATSSWARARSWAWVTTRTRARWHRTRWAATSSPTSPWCSRWAMSPWAATWSRTAAGSQATRWQDARNFPIKDNMIHGNLILHGWQGGLARGHPQPRRRERDRLQEREHLDSSRPDGQGGATAMDPDSNEVMGSDAHLLRLGRSSRRRLVAT